MKHNNVHNKKNYYLYFELNHINIVKILFETLGTNVDIVRLILSKNKDKTELEITSTNSIRTFNFKSKFGDKLIKNYFCENEKIEIELIPNDIVNILKSYDSTDNLLLFYINSDNKKNMIIEFKCIDTDNSISESETETDSELKKTKKIKNTKKSKKITKEKKFTLNIGYPIYPEKQLLKINFEKKISIDIDSFNKVCKNLHILFKNIKISSKNNKSFCLGYDSNKYDGLMKFNYDESNVILENIQNLKNNNISGVYCIEDIVKFTKLSDITTDYYLMIKNNNFLESTHIIGEYGIINIRFIPLREDIIKNSSNTYDLDNYDNLSNSSNSSNLSKASNYNDSTIEKKSELKKNKKTINDKIIYIEIDKIELFKILCECIEKIVSEPIFKLDTGDEKMKINIFCSNNSKNINLDVNILNIFGRYKKLEKTINLGIELKYLNDILKTVDKTDKIIFSIDPEDKHNLTIQIKNKIKSEDNLDLKRIYKLKLLNVEDTESINLIKSTNHMYKIYIDSDEFYKISKDINTIGDEIKIFYDNKNLIFSSINECKYANIIKKDNDMIIVENSDNENIELNKKIINEFEIKDIMIFSKLSGYMEEFNINLSSDGRFIINSDFGESSGSISIQYLSKITSDISPIDKNLIKSDVENMENKLIFLKLKEINFMKNIIDTLDKMVSHVEWVFTSNNTNTNTNTDFINNEDKIFMGLEMTCTDPSKTLYVKTKLTDKLFKSYYCCKNIFKFGMNLEYYNKILKLVEKSDIAIYCYIEKNDPSNLVIRFKNLEKKNKRIFKIPLQIINTKENKTQLSLNFEKKISLKCESLFSKCKIINNNSQFVKIECDGEKLFFKCVGDKEGILTLDSNDDNSLEIINLNENKVEGSYEIKNILLFTRLSTITKEFSFYMKNNFALTSIYNFGVNGSISVILSPSSEEHINNQLYDYSDDEEDEIELLNTNSNFIDLY
jgi:hypothetical protein